MFKTLWSSSPDGNSELCVLALEKTFARGIPRAFKISPGAYSRRCLSVLRAEYFERSSAAKYVDRLGREV